MTQVVDCFLKNGDRNNLLNAAVLELLGYLCKDSHIEVIEDMGAKGLMDRLAPLGHLEAVRRIRGYYDRISNPPPPGVAEEEEKQARARQFELLALQRRRRDDRALDREEEDYFSSDKDDDVRWLELGGPAPAPRWVPICRVTVPTG